MLPHLLPRNSPTLSRTPQKHSRTPKPSHTSIHTRRKLDTRLAELGVSYTYDERSSGLIKPHPSLPHISSRHYAQQNTISSAKATQLVSKAPLVHRSFQGRQQKIEGIEQQYTAVKEARLRRQLKQTLCIALEKRYKVSLPFLEMCSLTEREILANAKEIWRTQLARKALAQMKHWLHQTIAIRSIEVEFARVHIAAYTIQLYWRKYKVRNKQETVIACRQQQTLRHAAATQIQKVYRGYK